MVDFVEYVVSELSSKRLSKRDALALITQYRRRTTGGTRAAVLHPLLHRNSSDLTQQSYETRFDGSEPFLRDHRVDGHMMLPGVAYLEMVRAAIDSALPGRAAGSLSLRNVIWAQPIVVADSAEVRLALFPADGNAGSERIEYEVYSVQVGADGAETEVVHSQGLAVLEAAPAPQRLDLAGLRARMSRGQWSGQQVYAAYDKMSISYGPTHRGVSAILRGEGQLLAELALPQEAQEGAGAYVLHPGLMDAAVQSAVGFVEDIGAGPDRPGLPFALDSVRIVSACTREMFAWLRFAPGSRPGDKITKLDLDLCDPDGNVCVQMRGFTSRTLKAAGAVDATGAIGTIYAAPAWETLPLDAAAIVEAQPAPQRHFILCGEVCAHADALRNALAGSEVLCLPGAPDQDAAGRYREVARACFAHVKEVLAGRPAGPVLVQVVAADEGDGALLAGLAGLFKSAAIENPALTGQVVLVAPQAQAEELARRLDAERQHAHDTVVSHARGERQVLAWRELADDAADAPCAFKDGGVYLVTGGLGGLGMLFARAIVEQVKGAKLVLAGRSAPDADRQARLDQLAAQAGACDGAVVYREVDLAIEGQVRELVSGITAEYGRLDGILHCAGMIRDSFIVKKGVEDFDAVLEPKVAGTYNLDEASGDLDLDFMVLFSAGAAVTGNAGQSDYAAANGFMDRFAHYRNGLAASGRRKGKTRSINWPLWQDGGMGVDEATRERMRQSVGLLPLRSASGLRAFHEILALPHGQVQVAEGDVDRLRAALFPAAPAASCAAADAAQPAADGPGGAGVLQEKTEHFLKKRLSAVLKLPANRIDAAAPFERYGINSIMTMDLTNELEKIFGSLPKTLFFEYQTLAELAGYFLRSHGAQLAALFAEAPAAPGAAANAPRSAPPVAASPVASRAARRRRFAGGTAAGRAAATAAADPIAIVGLSGRYPGARDLDEYWANLRDGKDSIVEVPAQRWDWREYFSDDRAEAGRHYSKWGGFIDGVDEFDALFFNIPPVDAERIDPQERLFLQHAWMALEDAGQTRASLQVARADGRADQPGQVGVYVGVMYGEYQLYGAESSLLGERMVTPSSYASIANRVSYFLNLHGPSMAVDTMCSSSLTAIHLACQDLRQGRTDLAIAGGVNVTIHPNKYLLLSSGQFIATDGRCQSFGVGGDGYIPAEGVGALILKRLSEAERDGNHIYGVIKGSALNHGGKTNGYSVPNPQAQASVIVRAMNEYGVEPRHISYIEAHGTGTRLGDPIEIAALTQAFRRDGADGTQCLIGSAKSNIGHAESAAGIAGLTKVLLQMKHRQIAPSLHSATLNPHIDFDKTPFVVNQSLREWAQPELDGVRLPRIAGISSFGAGGSNAHLIVEEYAATRARPEFQGRDAPAAVVLSARTPEQLAQKIADLRAFIHAHGGALDLHALASTLQLGREAMEERFALVASSVGQLEQRLQAWLDGDRDIEDSYRGQARHGDEATSLFRTDVDLQETVGKWFAGRKLSRLLELWAKGLDLDWNRLYGAGRPGFVSLPTYPFARERCWIDRVAGPILAAPGAVLHPLLHANTSDFGRQSYRTVFTGSEFFLNDHRVRIGAGPAQKVLPGVAYLEMARAAIGQAVPSQAPGVLELRHVVWARPLVVARRCEVEIVLDANQHGGIDFEIVGSESGGETIHCRGQAVFAGTAAPARLDLASLAARMTAGELSADEAYRAYERMGLAYGPAQRALATVALGQGEVLARLRLPPALAASLAQYTLHPSLADGALQAAIGLVESLDANAGEARLPFALESLRIVSACSAEMVAWVRYSPGSGPDDQVVKLDIDLCDADGNACVQMRGFASRAQGEEARAIGSLLAVPAWEAAPASGARQGGVAEHHVLLCAVPQVVAAELEALVPGSQCRRLDAAHGATLADRYQQLALACFEEVRAILARSTEGSVLVQLVAAHDGDDALLAGLSGLFQTAAQENPRFAGQVVLASSDIACEALARQLQQDMAAPDTLAMHADDTRRAPRWRELPAQPEAAGVAFKDDGVYLITGGLGGLGVLFAREILAQTAKAKLILTGRSALDAERQAILDRLLAAPGRLAYRTLDLEDAAQVERLVAAVVAQHGQLNGILHSAGMVADNFILKKSASEFSQVLLPKVTGAVNLDLATRNIALDFLVLFSSTSGALGNAGQADYAAANGFMDQFAAYRNRLVLGGGRQGRTLSVNWPLWREGGMQIDEPVREMLWRSTGVQPLQTATGMQALYRALAAGNDQVMVLEGDLARLRALIAGQGRQRMAQAEHAAPLAASATVPAAVSATTPAAGDGVLAERAENYLRQQFSDVLKLPAHRIDARAPLENYGIDSVVAMKLTAVLEQRFGSLSKTLFFEYQTIASLAGYLLNAFPQAMRQELGQDPSPPVPVAAAATGPAPAGVLRAKNRYVGASAPAVRQVAIVGLSGRYPQAANLDEFWNNLKSGRDCITEVPSERWDHARYFDPDKNKPGKTYAKWGGFLSDVDKFDPLFFNISPKEAEVIDPQERLFLETAWETIEDAGYSRESLAGKRVGVFVGAMWGHYELFGPAALAAGHAAIPTSSHASIANRVSYFFDFRGPSIALDTMCSSSLTAIHLASEEIRRGNVDAALAGGINLSIHPQKYLNLSQGRFAASDGRCRSFGQGGDGYVPGEGVGAVLLKPLEDALRDGDHVYAVLKASALNHGGKTNGYTVPNPNAQGELILETLNKADIDPRTLDYVETHGTGTALGDPIEITGLRQAFAGFGTDKQACPIGSVKSNIGHLESAAGIAAVTKVLLQFKHGQLVPSLHAQPLNPNIDFADSPFYVQTELADWRRRAQQPRRAAVSSFGAGGSNAHLILEEYVGATTQAGAPAASGPELFVLSARNRAALVRYAARVADFLEQADGVSLGEIAYTSQVGRSAMAERLAVVASGTDELKRKLARWAAVRADGCDAPGDVGTAAEADVYHGNVNAAQYDAGKLIQGAAGQAFLDDLLARRDWPRIAALWILGANIDWPRAYGGGVPRRASLPTYPFARERHWIDVPALPFGPTAGPAQPAAAPAAEAASRTFYRPQWTAQALPQRAAASTLAGPILVLDTQDAFAHAFAAQLAQRHPADPAQAVILARLGGAYAEQPDGSFTLDPASDADFERLAAALAAKGRLPRVILHRYPEAGDGLQDEAQRAEQFKSQLDRGVHTLLQACKALMKLKHHTPTQLVSFYSGSTPAAAPVAAALAGFYRTLHLEHPNYVGKVVDVGAAGAGVTLAEEAVLLLGELDAGGAPAEIRYRRDGASPWLREVREYLAFSPGTGAGAGLPLRHRGVYLITGGLGGLGAIFAEYLARTLQARLVLTGRSAPGRRHEEMLERMRAHGAEVLYLRADVAQLSDTESLVREATARFGRIDGVIHSAGVTRDAFIFKKTRDDMDAVLAPKVAGAINLDLATRGQQLDLFAVFSSVAGALGNLGQCDYAYANRFLDAFAERRDDMRLAGERHGRTLAIDWPFWQDGGMTLGADAVALSEKHTGMRPLPTAEGLAYWEDFLRSDLVQGLALYGTPSRIAAWVGRGTQQERTERRELAEARPGSSPAALPAQAEAYLKGLIGEEIKLAPERIDAREPLASFGIDSIMVGRLNERLESRFGLLPKTLFYEYETVEELAKYFVRELPHALAGLLDDAGAADAAPIEEAAHAAPEPAPADRLVPGADEPIAIVGVHGYYPQSPDLAGYWENLRSGRDMVGVVPGERWDADAFYDADPGRAADGKIYCRWGGFLDDVDKFDASFFNIAADEARMMDPQERLFLQSVWAAFEDAGCTRESLKRDFPKGRGADVGVFVGVTTNSYQLLAAEEWKRGNFASPGALPWSIANRVSYFFDFQGPSIPVDTACSSASVAIHLACESLRRGESQVAVAGGVNLYLHPAKYHGLCRKGMLAAGGKCRSYGAGDDGFVPGEAIGTLILKPLSKAVEQGDHIYGLIRASAYEHSGRSNAYSAPNPNSQASLIAATLARAGVDADTIGYVEGHGTGTQLGDSLEIRALTQAFGRQTAKRQFCALGSAKASQGHAESAAGIAAVTKVLLQMKHGQLAPTLHSDEVNPDIAFERTPFYLQHGLSSWERPARHPRRALVNAFGAGGVNACLVLEEYEGQGGRGAARQGQAQAQLVVLSARNEERLRAYADLLLAHLRKEPQTGLADLAYTLQVGREAMPERLAVVAADLGELVGRLEAWRGDDACPAVRRGSLDPRRGAGRTGGTGRERMAALVAAHDLDGLAQAWAAGEQVDWNGLHAHGRPARIALPSYPFARERHWVADALAAARPLPAADEPARLHPLVSHNSSTLREVSFSSMLSGSAFYARDHQVGGQRIFPGAGMLEIACVAGALAGTRTVRRIRDIVFVRPLVFTDEAQMIQIALRPADDDAEYLITSYGADREKLVHSEGVIDFDDGSQGHGAEELVPIAALKQACAQPVPGERYYQLFEQAGISYGPAFRTMQELYVGESFALARLAIPEQLKAGFDQFVLHPAIVDGALQAVAGMAGGAEAGDPCLPFAIDAVEIARATAQACYAHVQEVGPAAGSRERAGIRKFDIRITNEEGLVLVTLKRFSVRAFKTVSSGVTAGA